MANQLWETLKSFSAEVGLQIVGGYREFRQDELPQSFVDLIPEDCPDELRARFEPILRELDQIYLEGEPG